jgi:hypothetical protein
LLVIRIANERGRDKARGQDNDENLIEEEDMDMVVEDEEKEPSTVFLFKHFYLIYNFS